MNGTIELVVRALLSAIFGVSCMFFLKLWEVRSYVGHLQRQGLPMPPRHWILGHIPLMAEIVKGMAPHAHAVYVADQIRQKYPALTSAFYLDIWPFGSPILAVLRPEMMFQLTQGQQIVPKDRGLRSFLIPLTGQNSLITMEEQESKHWRTIFNPGFTTIQINSLVPSMVDKVRIFKGLLQERAKAHESFLLEDFVFTLTIDIIGEAVMDHDFKSQTQYNDMTSTLQNQLSWSTTGLEINPLDNLNVIRPLIHIYNNWRMNRYLTRQLDELNNSVLVKSRKFGKSIIALALKVYLAENPSVKSIPDDFKEVAIAQTKTFLFAGHETTSSIVFTYHLLSQHPEALVRVRAEHDAILGPLPSQAENLLRSKPELLDELRYTLATIKETLRMYPLVAVLREGQPGFALRSKAGQLFPTRGCMIWGDNYATHHNPHVWPRPKEYLPERWLCSENDPLYPPKNAWRLFERGPRNCIEQELAFTEMKLILALTIREFNIIDDYVNFDRRKGKAGNREMNGQRAYMARAGGTGHPADGYPCRVSLTQRKEVI